MIKVEIKEDQLWVTFPYSEELVEKIKTIKGGDGIVTRGAGAYNITWKMQNSC